jgi:hypothetical protein
MGVEPKLKRCMWNCCLFVDGQAATNEEYQEALRRHFPGREEGSGPFVTEEIVGCKNPQRDKLR